MKKSILILIVAMVALVGCEKENDTPEVEINHYANTSWTAPDDIAELIYGKTCTTTIEFFNDFTCQEIDIRIGMKFGAGTFVEEGTYRINNDSVYWTIGDRTIRGIAKGSVLTTSMGTIAGGKRVYTKD